MKLVITLEIGIFPGLANNAGLLIWAREHNMVRFKHGAPSAVWFSQHEYGEAYTYEAVNKAGLRPLSFSAKGTHANYARSGKHDLHKQRQPPSSSLSTLTDTSQKKRFLKVLCMTTPHMASSGILPCRRTSILSYLEPRCLLL